MTALLDFMADACHYAQEHIDDPAAWPTDKYDREEYLQCVSHQMACFLSQNTKHGHNGVETAVVLGPLCEYPMKSAEEWKSILEKEVNDLGGWKNDE